MALGQPAAVSHRNENRSHPNLPTRSETCAYIPNDAFSHVHHVQRPGPGPYVTSSTIE